MTCGPIPSVEPSARARPSSASFGRFTDEQLARLLTSGQTAAFDELYRRYAQRLAAYGGRLLGDRSSGEDVAQTSLFNALQALQRGAEPIRVRSWLYRTARNAALEILARRRDTVGIPEAESRPAKDAQAAHDTRGALLAALDTLCERQRSVFLLREVRGLSVREIATELEITTEQVEQALFAARNRLAEVLVFGERLDCEAVGRLHGRLARPERRALKAHLRSCAPCRATAPARLSLGLLPVQLVAMVRNFAGGLFGGAGAPAAKVGAAVAAGSLAVGVPVAAETIELKTPGRTAARTPASVEAAAPARKAPPWSVDRRAVSWGLSVPSFLQPPPPVPGRNRPVSVAPPTDQTAPAEEEQAPADESSEEVTAEEPTSEVVDEGQADPPAAEPDPSYSEAADPGATEPAPDPGLTDPSAAQPDPCVDCPADPPADPAADPAPAA